MTQSKFRRTAMPPVIAAMLVRRRRPHAGFVGGRTGRLPCAPVAGAVAALALLAACSQLPAHAWPPFEECAVEARFPVTDRRPIALPVSGDALTILACDIEPQPLREVFTAAQRFVEPPAGCRELRVRCRYRIYPTSEAPPRTPNELFPGAAVVRTH